MDQTVGNFVYNYSRYLYNSAFHEGQLFETQYVRKLMSMYKFTNPHTLFYDTVKCGVVTNDKTCQKTSVTKGAIKISGSRNSHDYSTHEGVKKFTKYVNMYDIRKSHCHDFNTLSEHRATHSKHVQGVHNVFHENRFEMLTDENVHSDGDSDCNDSIFVELNNKNACSTSKGMNVSTVSENAHKGKNVPYLSDKIFLSEIVVHQCENKTVKIKNMTKQVNCHELKCLVLQCMTNVPVRIP